MKERWIVLNKGADFQAIGQAFGIDPVVARVIRNRELKSQSEIRRFLMGGRADLHDPHLLKDADLAAGILKEKISAGKRIRIIGDYDIDGVQATYILLQGLRRCGAMVDHAIPDRMKDGYGINENLIRLAAADGIDTIVTCDNGIAAFEPISLAGELGMTVIVTDHHEVSVVEIDGIHRQRLVEAAAVINPHRQDCTYPFSGLCGAAVAWKFVQVLYEAMDIPVQEADAFVENAGFATVGDVMSLVDENRIMVKLALELLNHTRNLGMRALILQNQIRFGEVKAWHIGFRLGPCLNASGRLDTAKRALALLLAENEVQAGALAAELIALNEERKDMTALAVAEAKRMIEENRMEEDRVLVIDLPECHESLAGIVAGRIREAYHRPVLVVTRGEESAKGSGRSIEAYSMYQELNACGELFLRFGGHPMAAGFSLEEEKIPQLRQRLNANCQLTEEDLAPKVSIDVVLPVDYISLDMIHQLELLEPFGKDNEKPVFADKNLEILSVALRGKEGRVVGLKLRSSYGNTLEGVYFGEAAGLFQTIAEKYGQILAERVMAGERDTGVKLNFSYYPDINTYGGRESIQLKITGFC